MSINQALWMERVHEHGRYMEQQVAELKKRLLEYEGKQVILSTCFEEYPPWITDNMLTIVGQYSVPLSVTSEELIGMLAVAKSGEKKAAQILSITLALYCHCL